MTREEAINILKNPHVAMFNDNEAFLTACKIAIRSIEACAEVLDDLAKYEEEYSDTDDNGNHNLKWCAIKEVEARVRERLKEVKE